MEEKTAERCAGNFGLYVPVAVEMRERELGVSTPSFPLQALLGLAPSSSENAEAVADSLEAQFQPVNDPSDLAFNEVVDVAMR
jgi:hypothetical protein